MDAQQVRVRFAPSPTGAPHIGNIRTALFNWLLARHHGGTFILRIEDTDLARTVPGALEAIFAALRWLGLDWDEGPGVGGPQAPYFQSERLPLYHDLAGQLISGGHAYRCYCTVERLADMRKAQEAAKLPPGYDRTCRNLAPRERAEREAADLPSVIRFRVPLEGDTTFNDLIRGPITFVNATIDDFVMIKSDGYPTYQFASVVDDHAMGITHVLRGDEWIPSTPRHVLQYRAFGWDLPAFAHLPIILGPDGGKLSKRHGATQVMEYRDAGYLPEALVNYLALLGWSYDDVHEIFTRQDLVEKFDLKRVHPTPARFSIDKLDWINAHYINHVLSVPDLAARCVPFLQEAGLLADPPTPAQVAYLEEVVPLIKERLKHLNEIGELTDFFFTETLSYDRGLLLPKQLPVEQAEAALTQAASALAGLPSFTIEPIEQALRDLAGSLGVKTGQLFMSLRVAVTGRTVSPGLFETMAVLGQQRTVERIRVAVEKLQGPG